VNDLLAIAKRRFQVLPYIRQWGAREDSPNEWVIRCPRCGKNNLTVNSVKKQWHCWSCQKMTAPDRWGISKADEGAGGLVELIETLEGVTREQALSRLISGVHWAQGELEALPGDQLKSAFDFAAHPAATVPYPEFSMPIVDGVLPYLVQRGISNEDVRTFGLFACTAGRYANRLIFPVYENQRLVYYQGRAMREAFPGELDFRKSLNPPRSPGAAVSSEVLMNLDLARNFPRVAVVEGPIDCVHAGPASVCCFGKRLSLVQVGKLLAAGIRALDLLWDADAWADTLAAIPFLSTIFDVRAIRLPWGDPGDHPRSFLDHLRGQAVSPASRLMRLE
jgi:hypothetical protein